ncbi:GDSL-type esterase/lipase family protein [Rarobacter faecitabidus]|uniref:Lysophospholipase L1-like esterase n=1 Tax=Rarobacter faecitabidus TaxID=13243 RepID=A0A542ZX93_RARFA|nr:GDSL-type esterase/lipase family protein [Rarobacter faecitabidus]TQL64972.1 lysophospholipase L1-like esterase [Rarobacter faecitabidus]
MSADGSAPIRILAVGDELVAGVGDPKAIGWLGRVTARTAPEIDLEVYTLAVPGETSTELSARWQDEAARRVSPDVETRLIVALGREDVRRGLSLARSRLNLANILDEATAQGLNPLVVGPPPGAAEEAGKLAELSAAYLDVASRRRAPYIELFKPLERHQQWLDDLASSGSGLPQQAGYGLIAWLVLHYGWRRWLGLAEDQ